MAAVTVLENLCVASTALRSRASFRRTTSKPSLPSIEEYAYKGIEKLLSNSSRTRRASSLDAELEQGTALLTSEANNNRVITTINGRRRSRTSPEHQSVEEGGEGFINERTWWPEDEDAGVGDYCCGEDRDSMLPKHMPCFMNPRHATMAIAFAAIIYGLLVVVSAVISLSTGHDHSTGTSEKSELFRIIQYSTAGIGGVFVVCSGLLVHGVRQSNRFLYLPWLVWAAIQIAAIFVGAILLFLSLDVTASMVFSLILNMIIAVVFTYCFLIVLEHYKQLAFAALPDAVRDEKERKNSKKTCDERQLI